MREEYSPWGSRRMSIRKRKDGRFVVDYYPNGRKGRRIRMVLPGSVADATTARAIEAGFRNPAQAEARYISPAATIRDIWPQFRDWYEMQRSPETYADIVRVFENSILRILGHIELQKFSPEHVTIYQRVRQHDKPIIGVRKGQKRVTNRTINKELSYLSGMLRWSRKRGHAVPIFQIEMLPAVRPMPVVLTIEEVRMLIDAAPPFYRALLLCMYSMGLRKKEATRLCYEDIDRRGRTVIVRQKGGTFKMLSVPTITMQAIEQIHGRWGTGLIFQSWRNPGEPIKDIRCALNKLIVEVGITKRVTPHLLRHSIATHLMSRGVNLRTIQKSLGHSSMQATEFYTHVAVEDLRQASDSMMLDYAKTKAVPDDDYKMSRKR